MSHDLEGPLEQSEVQVGDGRDWIESKVEAFWLSDKRVYVEPEVMREHLVTVFNAQLTAQRGVREDAVDFGGPDGVRYILGIERVPSWEPDTEEVRWCYYFDGTLEAFSKYMYDICTYGLQGLPEDKGVEDLVFLDPKFCLGIKPEDGMRGPVECRRLIRDCIPVISFKELCDWYYDCSGGDSVHRGQEWWRVYTTLKSEHGSG